MKCKVSKQCGGCTYLNMPEKQQAQIKQEQVEQLAAQYHIKARIGDVHMAAHPLHYRNKVIVGFAKQKGTIVSGLYAKHSHRVVPYDQCVLQPEIVNEIIAAITKMVQSMKIELYNEKTGTGVLRHVMIRWAHATGEIMVVFVTGSSMFPSRKNMVRALTKQFPQIKTILQEVNGRNTSVVMEREPMVLYGNGTITDLLCGLKLRYSATAFYQIHSEQCEALYDMARKMADLHPRDTLLDTYCGIGSIGLTLASSCGHVVGVEQNARALKDAAYNAQSNGIENIEFVPMDATAFMKEAAKYQQHFNVIVLDPPRAGTTRDFIQAAVSLKPRRIVYISCNPETLMRDLKRFKKSGYETRKIELYDLFPYSEHVEGICVLEKKYYNQAASRKKAEARKSFEAKKIKERKQRRRSK